MVISRGTSMGKRMTHLGVVLVLALLVLVCPSHGQVFTSYTVGIANGAQYGPDFGSVLNTIGPFANLAALGIVGGVAETWQIVIPLTTVTGAPMNFSFFGQNYSAVTLTSKGFMYLGAYQENDATNGINNLQTVAPAPDYTPSGSGFPSTTPVISFLQSAQGCVDDSKIYSYQSQYYIHNYFAQPLGPVTQTTVVKQPGRNTPGSTTTTYTRPAGSNATAADGPRFVIVSVDALQDFEGAQAQLVVSLYQSGLIEIFFYFLNQAFDPTYRQIRFDDHNRYSVGIQSGHVHYSAPSGGQYVFSMQNFTTLNGLNGLTYPTTRVLSYKPNFS